LNSWESEGWTINFIERESRYWVQSLAGLKNEELFELSTVKAWQWAKKSKYIRWFTDGETRYGKSLWKLASIYLKQVELNRNFSHRKVWREGLEVAMNIKGSQGNSRKKWVKIEHPYTFISPKEEVHANHNEALNSVIRRRCSAYRRKQNLYAKKVQGLNRAITVQRLIHNWVRPHFSLGKNVTPAMAIGYIKKPITIEKMLNCRNWQDNTA